MAKKDNAIYAPGELSRVRDRLGTLDDDEAKEIARKLGGDIGFERSETAEKAQQVSRNRQEKVNVKIGNQPTRRIELAPDEEYEAESKKPSRRADLDPADDPAVPLKTSYWERIKMDRLAGQSEFEIKSSAQVFYSVISVFADSADYVNPIFVARRLPEYYKRIESLVISTRNLFPRNNPKRNEKMKKSSPMAYSILDAIRYWDVEKISSELAKIQGHPKTVRVHDLAEITRSVYRPLFLLDRLDLEVHIRSTFKLLYKLLFVENPVEAQSKFQDLIRTALTAYSVVQRDLRYFLYPLFMKTVSPSFLTYEIFFAERKNRIMDFLRVNEDDQITPGDIPANLEDAEEEKPAEAAVEKAVEEKPQEPDSVKLPEDENAKPSGEESDRKSLERGLKSLEILFPKAGWDKLSSFPDFYPYFSGEFELRKGFINVAPTDPMSQVYILMRILEEFFFGLRHASFGTVQGSLGNVERADSIIGEIIGNWHFYIEESFGKEYLPRMSEYVRILEGSSEERYSPYCRKLVSELHWVKRIYFLPYYKFESFMPAPIQRKDATAIYTKIKTLRKYLSLVAFGIDQGNKSGGAEARALCEGIDNPWSSYVFQISNPVSRRLDAFLRPRVKNNASLLYFSLAVTTVLDYLVNSENSWAYDSSGGPLFRSVDGKGVTPMTGVDDKIDADALFKASLKQRQK